MTAILDYPEFVPPHTIDAVDTVDHTLNTILKFPKAFGSPEAVETLVLTMLHLHGKLHGFVSSQRHMDAYLSFLTSRGMNSSLPAVSNFEIEGWDDEEKVARLMNFLWAFAGFYRTEHFLLQGKLFAITNVTDETIVWEHRCDPNLYRLTLQRSSSPEDWVWSLSDANDPEPAVTGDLKSVVDQFFWSSD